MLNYIIYQRTLGTITNDMHVERVGHRASLLLNGQVLVMGGDLTPGTLSLSAELYNPSTKTWTITDGMHVNREAHTASLLSNGKV